METPIRWRKVRFARTRRGTGTASISVLVTMFEMPEVKVSRVLFVHCSNGFVLGLSICFGNSVRAIYIATIWL